VNQWDLLEVNLSPGEWCLLMMNDDIYYTTLSSTIAQWQLNSNNTANVLFQETNTTKYLDSSLTTNINITASYATPFSPVTRMVTNFSHVVLAYNNLDNETMLMSISYSGSIRIALGMALSLLITTMVTL